MKALFRWLILLCAAVLALQIFFVVSIALMAVLAPQSTSFERSQAWHILQQSGRLRWRQQWVDYPSISNHLKRAVIASEDGSFNQHEGLDWEAMEKAWEKNAKAEQLAAKQNATKSSKSGPVTTSANHLASPRVKVVGGSTITQQLAKNLFLSGERTLLRKSQEFVLTLLLEKMLSKQRILEIYLNHVEWGTGVFGAEAAAQHYFRKPASQLNAFEAARLAVMLPRPRVYEKLPDSVYLADRALSIMARMGDAKLP
ncbi:MAG: transglycosylase domain-containing protein [Burkholderiaceae bacterium]